MVAVSKVEGKLPTLESPGVEVARPFGPALSVRGRELHLGGSSVSGCHCWLWL